MNTKRICSKVMLSYHQYSSAYELEYSCLVIIMIYELAYSLCVMILTCSTLCLIIHMVCMSRSRVKLRWWFIVPSVLPISFTYRSIGSGTRGIWVVSLYMGVVLGCMETFGFDGAPRLRGRRQMVIALYLVIPLVRVLCRSFKVSRACWQTSAQRSPCPS